MLHFVYQRRKFKHARSRKCHLYNLSPGRQTTCPIYLTLIITSPDWYERGLKAWLTKMAHYSEQMKTQL